MIKCHYLPEEKIKKGVITKEIFIKDKKLMPFHTSFFIIEPGKASPIDAHQAQECWIVVNGTGIASCNNEILQIEKGDTIYFDSFKPHSVKNISFSNLDIISIWWYV
jgi:mannose-6-phosphate isomerase-like protein (cupin superfamily)